MPDPRFALITGASSGIGIDFAKEMARRGYSLLITARRLERLDELRKSIESEFEVTVDCIQADLATDEGVENLIEQVSKTGKKVEVLINNAGIGYFGGFFDQDFNDIEQMIQVNLRALARLTWHFGNEMIDHGKGHILNVSSYSAIQPPSDLSVYAATKSFVLHFSKVIARRNSNVSISTVCPGFFVSEFFDGSGREVKGAMKALMTSSESIAKIAVRGMFKRKAIIVPGIIYKISAFSVRFMPRWASLYVANLIVGRK